jgi:hypothetical protein
MPGCDIIAREERDNLRRPIHHKWGIVLILPLGNMMAPDIESQKKD